MTAVAALQALTRAAEPRRAAGMQRFFKTGPGEYAEGDRFLGLRVPAVRTLAREFDGLPLPQLRRLLASKWHEARLLALFVLVRQHRRGTDAARARIFRFYMSHTARINNWDLVDCSAPEIAGPHLVGSERARLLPLARSSRLWERRIAILATFHGIKKRDFAPALKVARLLVSDRHDLIHKAVGWMLREIGNRDRGAEEAFLQVHARHMPRTMLRYAIEKFPERLRQSYLRGMPASRCSTVSLCASHPAPGQRDL